MSRFVEHFYDLDVYKDTFQFQQRIFEISKAWPVAEKYALTDQVRRSSRSVGANLAEAWAKRRYPAHFLSKLTDADGELQETAHWLRSARACGYLDATTEQELNSNLSRIGSSLGRMITNHESFTLRA